jgi:hypothetical protein
MKGFRRRACFGYAEAVRIEATAGKPQAGAFLKFPEGRRFK